MSATLVIKAGHTERQYWRNFCIIEGRTSMTCQRRNAAALARIIRRYFQSKVYLQLESRRHEILRIVNKEHTWSNVASITAATYKAMPHEMERPLQLRDNKANNETASLNSHSGLRR